MSSLVVPEQFNVAVTRAKALTIVVGNPYVLYHDECWKQLLEFCVENGAYRGCDCSLLNVSEVNDVQSLLDVIAHESLLGRASASTVYPTDLADFFTDSPWRVML